MAPTILLRILRESKSVLRNIERVPNLHASGLCSAEISDILRSMLHLIPSRFFTTQEHATCENTNWI